MAAQELKFGPQWLSLWALMAQNCKYRVRKEKATSSEKRSHRNGESVFCRLHTFWHLSCSRRRRGGAQRWTGYLPFSPVCHRTNTKRQPFTLTFTLMGNLEPLVNLTLLTVCHWTFGRSFGFLQKSSYQLVWGMKMQLHTEKLDSNLVPVRWWWWLPHYFSSLGWLIKHKFIYECKYSSNYDGKYNSFITVTVFKCCMFYTFSVFMFQKIIKS